MFTISPLDFPRRQVAGFVLLVLGQMIYGEMLKVDRRCYFFNDRNSSITIDYWVLGDTFFFVHGWYYLFTLFQFSMYSSLDWCCIDFIPRAPGDRTWLSLVLSNFDPYRCNYVLFFQKKSKFETMFQKMQSRKVTSDLFPLFGWSTDGSSKLGTHSVNDDRHDRIIPAKLAQVAKWLWLSIVFMDVDEGCSDRLPVSGGCEICRSNCLRHQTGNRTKLRS